MHSLLTLLAVLLAITNVVLAVQFMALTKMESRGIRVAETCLSMLKALFFLALASRYIDPTHAFAIPPVAGAFGLTILLADNLLRIHVIFGVVEVKQSESQASVSAEVARHASR